MKWPTEKLGIVAPAKPMKSPKIADSNSVWLLNLDMVESHTGRVIDKLFCSADKAGTSTHWFDENYVLYSKLRPYLNKVVVPDGLGLATTELVPMLPDPERLDRKYLAYYLRSEQFVRWVNEQVAGAKMPRVSMKIFWEHEIPLPPLEEQKRIVTILDKADAIRQKRQQAIALADDFLRSVFLDMFGDPVTNPKGWEITNIGSLCNVSSGSTPSRQRDDYYKGSIPWVKTTEVDGYTIMDTEEHISEEALQESSCRLNEVGSILIAMYGQGKTRGKVGLLGIKAATNQACAVLSPSQKINMHYLYGFLSLSYENLRRLGQGGGQPNLNAGIIKAFSVPLPPRNLQDEFATIYEKIKYLQKEKETAQQQKNILLSSLSKKLFSGQL